MSEVHVYAVIQDVDYLVRGGRAGLVAAGARCDRPQVIAVRRHALPIGEAHNRKTAIRHLLEHAAEHASHGVHDWAVGHGDAADVDAFAAAGENRFGRAPAYVTTLGPPVGTHLGPDSLVLGFLAAR